LLFIAIFKDVYKDIKQESKKHIEKYKEISSFFQTTYGSKIHNGSIVFEGLDMNPGEFDKYVKEMETFSHNVHIQTADITHLVVPINETLDSAAKLLQEVGDKLHQENRLSSTTRKELRELKDSIETKRSDIKHFKQPCVEARDQYHHIVLLLASSLTQYHRYYRSIVQSQAGKDKRVLQLMLPAAKVSLK
jgi:ElaB/YqjD/DUF883 family membrane-anchored ribosome-binding protein